MYNYHGWLYTFETIDIDLVRNEIRELNRGYPSSCEVVNGQCHIAFSGNPNRDSGELEGIIELLTSKKKDLSGCVYLNDANNSEGIFTFRVIKVVRDKVTYIDDRNFSTSETDMLFR